MLCPERRRIYTPTLRPCIDSCLTSRGQHLCYYHTLQSCRHERDEARVADSSTSQLCIVLVGDMIRDRQKDKLEKGRQKEAGARHKAVRQKQAESGRAIGASETDATREGGDKSMSSAAAAKAIPNCASPSSASLLYRRPEPFRPSTLLPCRSTLFDPRVNPLDDCFFLPLRLLSL